METKYILKAIVKYMFLNLDHQLLRIIIIIQPNLWYDTKLYYVTEVILLYHIPTYIFYFKP